MKDIRMVSILLEEEVRIPAELDDLESFRRWTKSDDFPQRGRFAYLRGQVWVDLSMEQAFSHNRVKTRINSVLDDLTVSSGLGYYFSDGMSLSNVEVDLSTIADGVYVSYDAVRKGRVLLIAGAQGGCVELVGTPDMVLEVVSDTSVHKDTEELWQLYWQAGIPEYWLVDARTDELHFDIFRHGAKKYTATRKRGGWLKSRVFKRSFRLTRHADPLGNPQYILDMRP
jgi:Uma2 family endonuclease